MKTPAKTPIAIPAFVPLSLELDELLDEVEDADAVEASVVAVESAAVVDSAELEADELSVAMAKTPEISDPVAVLDATMAVGNESSSVLLLDVALALAEVVSEVSLAEVVVSFAVDLVVVGVASLSSDWVDVTVAATTFVDVSRSRVVSPPPAQPSGVSVL